MKKFLVLIVFLTGLFSAYASENPEVSFDTKTYDFGTVKESSKPVEMFFEMTNTGSSAVAILSASTSCGCSKAEFSKKPIEPGKSTKIKVKFNPAGQKGEIRREVKLRVKRAGGKSVYIPLWIEGVVVPK